MKTVINLSIGGVGFTIDEDAYKKLECYLDEFKSKTGSDSQSKEIMDEVEERIAELFTEATSGKQNVVTIFMVDKVISRIGMPDESAPDGEFKKGNSSKGPRKFYLDPDDRKIGGVCSGLAAYFNIDVVILRVIFVVALFCGSVGFWAYVIFWIIAPKATTAVQKCEMRGIQPTAENIKKYSFEK